jgi:hypothetical protein
MPLFMSLVEFAEAFSVAEPGRARDELPVARDRQRRSNANLEAVPIESAKPSQPAGGGPHVASVPSKSSSWRAASAPVGGRFARIAMLTCCRGDLANHSPITRHPPQAAPQNAISSQNGALRMRLALSTYPCPTTAVDPRRVAVASAALLTSIAAETQMHHFDARQDRRAVTLTSRRGLVALTPDASAALRRVHLCLARYYGDGLRSTPETAPPPSRGRRRH